MTILKVEKKAGLQPLPLKDIFGKTTGERSTSTVLNRKHFFLDKHKYNKIISMITFLPNGLHERHCYISKSR